MRIVSWNIGLFGLRGTRKRFGTLRRLLESLNADIICLQETKLLRGDLDLEHAVVDGWHSFFAFSKGKTGYSGTATLCRDSALPFAAEEGLTGSLDKSGKGGSLSVVANAPTGAFSELLDRWSLEELQVLDAEGRCCITDHGFFVLFNIYAPAITCDDRAAAEERFTYKMRFYQVLWLRAEAMRAAGRRVIIVGDFNISPELKDSCDPAPPHEFLARPDRVLLHSQLRGKNGPFLDVFRHFHPDRLEAYTCWSQVTGARANNYGTRIDLILAADGLSCTDGLSVESMFGAADLAIEVEGSDHAPVWADLALPSPLPAAAVAPPMSARLLLNKQQTIKSFFKRGPAATIDVSDANNRQSGIRQDIISRPPSSDLNDLQSGVREGIISRPSASGPTSDPALDVPPAAERGSQGRHNPKSAPVAKRVAAGSGTGFLRQGSGVRKPQGKRSGPGQASMRGFLRVSAQQVGCSAVGSAVAPAPAGPPVAGGKPREQADARLPSCIGSDPLPLSPEGGGVALAPAGPLEAGEKSRGQAQLSANFLVPCSRELRSGTTEISRGMLSGCVGSDPLLSSAEGGEGQEWGAGEAQLAEGVSPFGEGGEGSDGERGRAAGQTQLTEGEREGAASIPLKSGMPRTGVGGTGKDGRLLSAVSLREAPDEDYGLAHVPLPIPDNCLATQAAFRQMEVVCSGVFTDARDEFGTDVCRGVFSDARGEFGAGVCSGVFTGAREEFNAAEIGSEVAEVGGGVSGPVASRREGGEGERLTSSLSVELASCRDPGEGGEGERLTSSLSVEVASCRDPGEGGEGALTGGGPVGQPVAKVEAVAAWQRIRQLMKPPKCRGHGEECVVRHVKKGGINQGRVFYVCRRPDGPKPHGRCDHFAWAADRTIRGAPPEDRGAAKRVKRR